MAAFRLQDMPGSPLRNPAPRVPTAAPKSQLSHAEIFGYLRSYYAKHAPGSKSEADLQATAGRVFRTGTGRLNAPMKNKYGESFDEFVANIIPGVNVTAFHNPMYNNEVSINVNSAPAAACTAHAPSSFSATAFVVGDRVEIVGKGAGTVRFVGLHHVEGTYANSRHCCTGRCLLHSSPPPRRAIHTVLHRVYWAMALRTSPWSPGCLRTPRRLPLVSPDADVLQQTASRHTAAHAWCQLFCFRRILF